MPEVKSKLSAKAASAQKLQAVNPATGRIIKEIDEFPIKQVSAAYQNARAAEKEWSSLRMKERLAYFRELRYLMSRKLEQIVQIISSDTGKTKTEALTADVMPVLDALVYFEQNAERILSRQSTSTPLLFLGKKSYIEYMSRGAVLVISPWNFPLQLAMIPMLSALAGGNAVILKPSEVTPLVGLLIEVLFKEAGFPEHTVQVAHGGKELGAALTKGKPDFIFFTGSVKTGKIIQAQAARDLIPTILELGGKDPMIVFKDANIERAVNGAIWGAFTNSGQVCMSTERLYVERPIYNAFVAKMREKVIQLKQGYGDNDDIGSMTSPLQLDIVKEQLEDAVCKGAKLITGELPDYWDSSNEMFIKPIILVDVNEDMDIIKEETFGPVIPIIPFDSEEEAINMANNSLYGLNASVWTNDLEKAEKVVSKLVTGNAAINDVMVSVVNHGLPFGGVKQSGIGRYHGEGGLRAFCHEKAVMADTGKKNYEIQWYPYKGKHQLFLKLFQNIFGPDKKWGESAKLYLDIVKYSKK
ncbi:aldehyde dehydrogenase family protein [Metabacillus sp. RGM 3146]|uniref:aldehyde dehydrogenase family protein n=1 Tax=Metabacillus sp. RGM 3146 TaxID=3401092 RepID=UPI003B9AB76D